VIVSTDLNYCAKLWNYGKEPGSVMPALVEGCDVILGNEEDAEKHFGIHPDTVDVTQGDSFIYRLMTYDTDQQVLEFSAEASCLKHTIYRDMNLLTVAEFEKLIEGDTSGRVSL
jgi:sugar/nucleoside kinase (ribokinase family)